MSIACYYRSLERKTARLRVQGPACATAHAHHCPLEYFHISPSGSALKDSDPTVMSSSKRTYRRRQNHNNAKEFFQTLTVTAADGKQRLLASKMDNAENDGLRQGGSPTVPPEDSPKPSLDKHTEPSAKSKRSLSPTGVLTDEPQSKKVLMTPPPVESTSNNHKSSTGDKKEPGRDYNDMDDSMVNVADSSNISETSTIPPPVVNAGVLRDHIDSILPKILEYVMSDERHIQPYYMQGMMDYRYEDLTQQQLVDYCFADRSMIKANNINLSFLRVSKTLNQIGATLFYGTKIFTFWCPDACT